MLWYIIAALGVIVAGAVGLIIYLLVKKRATAPTKPAATSNDTTDEVTFGVLDLEDGTRRILDSDAFSIGRRSSNDLTIADPSVSRQHAEIHRRGDGTFTITDLDSMNGVFINNKQLKHATLKGGEHVELGNVGCQFKVIGESELDGDRP
jgi:hypothetical protein